MINQFNYSGIMLKEKDKIMTTGMFHEVIPLELIYVSVETKNNARECIATAMAYMLQAW